MDVKARIRYVPSPILPASYKDDRAYVRVVIAVKVNEDGKVTQTRIKDSYVDSSSRTPSQVIQTAALEAAGKALFQPAQQAGKPVPYWTGLTFEWGQKSGAVISDPGPEEAKAQLVSVPLPSYRDLDHHARFLVAVQVDEQGKVMRTHLENVSIEGGMERSSKKALLEEVLKAASQALFKPALRKGQPVTSWYLMKFEMGPKAQRP